ncbi:MAG TPA: substrate-binding domain-containing protein [Candidatus Deferrimicrobiaceae bacterium]
MDSAAPIGENRYLPRCFACAAVLAVLSLLTAGSAPARGETIRISGTGGSMETMKLLAAAFRKVHPEIHIVNLPNVGSSAAIKAVLAGALDVGVTSRPLTADEERRGAVQHQFAITPLVIATGPRTRASGLTTGQLAEIYAGSITTWPDGSPIRLVLRPEGDSDTLTLRRLSHDLDRALKAALANKRMPVAMTDQDSADMLERVSGALGTVTLAQIFTEKRAVKMLSLNGVAPTLESLKDGSYPLSKTLYLVTRGVPSSPAGLLVNYTRSAAGRALLSKTGHVARAGKNGS